MSTDKGIVMAGGTGSRLIPATIGVSKHLLPVYDKPLVHYPLSVLMLAGIRDILVISTPDELPAFERAMGDGQRLGISIRYAPQPHPAGTAQAFIIGREFVGHDKVALVFGDNIFYGQGFREMLARAQTRSDGATIFAHAVKDPGSYSAIELDDAGLAVSLSETPKHSLSNLTVTGLGFYDNDVVEIAAGLNPSARDELEIDDVNRHYLSHGRLHVEILGRGFAWMDVDEPESLMRAASFVQKIEQRQGNKIACLEEVAYRMGFITAEQLQSLAGAFPNEYGDYLRDVLSEPTSLWEST